MSAEKEMSLKEMPGIIKGIFLYLLSKWMIIAIITILCVILGIFYALNTKPLYTAEITFAPENEKGSSMGMYAGIAAQFGVDLGGGNGGAFEGENLIEFLKSNMLIEKALLSPLDPAQPNNLIIHQYLRGTGREDDFKENDKLKGMVFSPNQQPDRLRDSIMNTVIKNIENDLVIEKVDKKLNIISVKQTSHDEVFSKKFVEALVDNGIQYYVDYRSKKTRENVQILQRQTDSVRGMLRGGIVSVAATSDLNVNPLRQIVRTGVQKQQVDVQVNGQLYGELLKQLELSKISLRKETPLVQIIDQPRYPLEKKKMGRLKGGIIFGLIGFLITVVILLFKRLFTA